MKLSFIFGLILAGAGPGFAAQFKIGQHTFTVPDGFEVELVAGSPLVDRPMLASFDEQGRLYVADSSGSNENIQKQLAERPHRIVRLEDSNGDGRFDKSVVFADQMMFPEGAMWFNGSLYVGAPPSIWKLTDTTGDGVADQREEWFQGKTLTGCANDLHGPYPGPDGWIYWCKGAFAKQTYEIPGREPFVTRAAHIFRARPDGTGIEAVMTGGMDNPVGLTFTREGERIFSTTFFQHPQAGRRDGLVHAIYGGVYGKIHDVIDEHPRTGEVMPVLAHLGAAAPSGLTRYQSRVFGNDFENNLFAALFNMRKVTRHILQPDGATFSSVDSDFLVSDNTDFHPTDVLEDADGSLLVIDTGGWYKICCPTSQLAKPDVLGAIYRIRRANAPGMEDARGLRINWGELPPRALTRLLDDSRPAVSRRAVRELGFIGASAVTALTETVRAGNSPSAKLNAVWALTRIEAPEARAAVRSALNDKDAGVRQAALHSISLRRDAAAVPALIEILTEAPAPLQRAAAEALGRIGSNDAVPRLLEAAAGEKERAREHSIIYALIEIADAEQTAAGLNAEESRTRRAALIALDQMRGGGLVPAQITPLLVSSDPVLKETAAWIVSRHAEWGGHLAEFFRARLDNFTPETVPELEGQLSQFGRNPAVRELLGGALGRAGISRDAQILVLRSMARSGVRETPAIWMGGLVAALEGNDFEIGAEAVGTMRRLPAVKEGAESITRALLLVARNQEYPPEIRLEALASVPGQTAPLSPDLFQFALDNLASDQPVRNRAAAAQVVQKARLDTTELRELTRQMKKIGPMELPKILAAFEQASEETLGRELIEALRQSSAGASLREELLKPHLKNFPEAIQKEADAWLVSLDSDLAEKGKYLEELLNTLPSGDIRNGQAIFNSPQAACAACHAIGYLGGDLGPDLTNIGTVRTGRDLLESIVFPSASFTRSYETVLVATREGEEHSGILRGESSEEIRLATGPGVELRIAREEITGMRPGAVSLMPGGLHEQLNPQALADLLAFLKNTRWGAN